MRKGTVRSTNTCSMQHLIAELKETDTGVKMAFWRLAVQIPTGRRSKAGR